MSLATVTGAKTSLLVGLADYKVSHDPGVVLYSLPLGSCLGVVIYEPALKLAGLLHSLLPSSNFDPDRAAKFPGMFLDAGLPAMIKQAVDLGAKQENLEVYVAGGAQVMDDSTYFNIGGRHYEILTGLLEEMGLSIHGEDVGGRTNRSVQVDVDTGEVRIKTSGQPQPRTLCKR